MATPAPTQEQIDAFNAAFSSGDYATARRMANEAGYSDQEIANWYSAQSGGRVTPEQAMQGIVQINSAENAPTQNAIYASLDAGDAIGAYNIAKQSGLTDQQIAKLYSDYTGGEVSAEQAFANINNFNRQDDPITTDGKIPTMEAGQERVTGDTTYDSAKLGDTPQADATGYDPADQADTTTAETTAYDAADQADTTTAETTNYTQAAQAPVTQAQAFTTADKVQGYDAQGYDAAQWNVSPDELVSNRVDSIIGANSPLMQRAVTRAGQQMNARGLINSSMAIGAGQSALYDAAAPMAQHEAQTYANAAASNQGATNQARQFGAAATNQARQFTAGAKNQALAQDAGAQTNVSITNAGASNTAALDYARRADAAGQFGADAQNRAFLQSADAYNRAALDFAGRTDAAGQFGADAQNRAYLQSADAYNRAALDYAGRADQSQAFGANAANEASRYNAGLIQGAQFDQARRDDAASQFDITETQRQRQFNADQYNETSRFNSGQWNASSLSYQQQLNDLKKLGMSNDHAMALQEMTNRHQVLLNTSKIAADAQSDVMKLIGGIYANPEISAQDKANFAATMQEQQESFYFLIGNVLQGTKTLDQFGLDGEEETNTDPLANWSTGDPAPAGYYIDGTTGQPVRDQTIADWTMGKSFDTNNYRVDKGKLVRTTPYDQPSDAPITADTWKQGLPPPKGFVVMFDPSSGRQYLRPGSAY